MEINNLFNKRNIKKTKVRSELLELFTVSDSSFSVPDILKKINATKDKVTIYRALVLFENKGLIHKVPDSDSKLRYALCSLECVSAVHTHSHAHLVCTECSDTFCMDDIKLPEFSFSTKIFVDHYELILNGKCENCLS